MIKKQTKKTLKKLEKKERNKKDKEWKKSVKIRDNYVCVICNATERINCHHIIPKEIKEFRWDVNNGICLCAKHHKWGIESSHKNGLWFFNYMQKERSWQLKYLIQAYEKWKKLEE